MQVSCILDIFFTIWATSKAPNMFLLRILLDEAHTHTHTHTHTQYAINMQTEFKGLISFKIVTA